MTNEAHNRSNLEKRLEIIEDRVRDGRPIDDLEDPELQGAADALKLIQRVKRQQQQETAAVAETVAIAGPANLDRGTPEQIGRFEIREKLGQGGFGVVFRAFDPELQRDIALKIPRPHAIATPDLRERFFREGRAVAALAHPGIVPIFETGSAGPICYTASQYINGPSLAEYAVDHKLTPRESAEIIRQVAESVAHAHQRGVLHRDIKAANILIDSVDQSLPIQDRLRLTDFGLAKNLGEASTQTQSGDFLGTPAYMSPEQIDNPATSGPASDVYSLGAVLYELLTGRPPFEGLTVLDTIEDVRKSEPVPPAKRDASIPQDLSAICCKCLEKNPESRYTSSTALADDLDRFLNHETVIARHPGWLVRTGRWVRRNPVAATLLAVISISAVITTLLLLRSENLRQTAELRGEQLAEKSQQLRFAVDRLFVAMADSPELELAALDPFKKRLLQEVRLFREQLTQESPEDQDLLLDHWRTTQTLTALTWNLGDHQTALEIAKELLEEIEQQDLPDDFDYLALARMQINCLNLFAKNESGSASSAAFRKYEDQIVSIAEEIAKATVNTNDSQAGQVLLAESLSTLANQNTLLGEYDRSQELNRRSIGIWQTIPIEHMSESAAEKCASSWLVAATTAVNSNDMQYTIDCCDNAIAILEPLIEGKPEPPTEPYLTLSESLRIRGYAISRSPARKDEAISSSRRALEIAQELAVRHPWQEQYQRLPAVAGYSLALQQYIAGERDQAESLFRDNADLLDRLIIRFPDDKNNLSGHLANNLTMLGFCYKHRGDVEKQLELLDRSRAMVESQITDDEASPALQVRLAGIDGERAWCMAKLGQNKPALDLINDAIHRLEDRLGIGYEDEQASRYLNGNREFRVDILIRSRSFDRADAELEMLITDQAGSNRIGRTKDRLKLEVFSGNDEAALAAIEDFGDVYLASVDPQAWLHAARFAAEMLLEMDGRDDASLECERAIIQLGLSALEKIVDNVDGEEAKANAKRQMMEDPKLQRIRENEAFQSWFSS